MVQSNEITWSVGAKNVTISSLWNASAKLIAFSKLTSLLSSECLYRTSNTSPAGGNITYNINNSSQQITSVQCQHFTNYLGRLKPGRLLRAKLHYTDTGYEHEHHQRTNSQYSTTNLPHRNAWAQHLDMSRCWDVANFCPLVVFVGGVPSRFPCSGVWL